MQGGPQTQVRQLLLTLRLLPIRVVISASGVTTLDILRMLETSQALRQEQECQIQKTTLSEPKLQLISNSSPSLTAGLGTQVGGQLLSFGTNYQQGGNRNNSYVGGYFRIDTRTGAESEFFNIQRIPASGSESVIFKVSSTGSVVASGNVTAYSDERLKSNIETIDNALDKVNALRGVTFTKDGERGLGVIAQEVEKVLPEVVLDGEYKSVAYGNIVGVLIEAVKEQNAKIERLEGLIELMLKDK